MLDKKKLFSKSFEKNGRGPDSFDCYGLCLEIYRQLGRKLPDINTPEGFALMHDAIVDGKKHFTKRLAGPKPYCLVTMIIRAPYVSHIGVVLEDCKRFIHIMQKRQVSIERLDKWNHRIEGYYELTTS